MHPKMMGESQKEEKVNGCFKNDKGFTFIEAILVMVVLSGGLFGVMHLFHQNVATAEDRKLVLVATLLAQEKLEAMTADKEFNLYASINSTNYPSSSEDLTSLGYPGFNRATTIQEVNPVDLSSTQAGSGYKKITVSVSWTGGQTVMLTTLLTE